MFCLELTYVKLFIYKRFCCFHCLKIIIFKNVSVILLHFCEDVNSQRAQQPTADRGVFIEFF